MSSGPSKQLFARVLESGIARGEVRADALGDLVLDVIPAMMTYRSKVCGSEWPDAEMADAGPLGTGLTEPAARGRNA